ncbi:Fe-S cluster assembly protein SufD [Halostella sp. JP-L12]|uniref:Fe-S cluster assembly protein SufD n=1 Tax=Halostella TaxID=1843185 RepID=UPI000EF7D619|nr:MULTISPECIES: Fe-S cluster assembly protein SufD [Halostella]NHN47582.1 Fe-S cluster assembly protein SufD [Halostella sp. JP-L12]
MSTQVHAALDEGTVREISESLDEPEWLLETRLEALEALDGLDMPSVIRTPGREWTNLHDLDFEGFVDPLNAAEDKDQVGPDEVEVLPFAEAVDEHEELVKEHFGSVVDPQDNYLTALSTALFNTGTVVYVPEGVDAEDVKVRTRMNSRSLFNYTLVVTEESSSVTILERQSTGEDVEGERYYSGLVEVVAGENSNVQYGSLQNLDEETYNYTLKRGHADTYATIDWIEGNIGSRLTKSSVETYLKGDSSESQIVGAFFGHEDQHFDVNARVWHEAEHTTADLVTRGVLDDRARSVYEGVQDVGSGAWDTNSYQRENTLMLSDESEADASPKLIINNHDTEASHSATVGQVSEEDLFYMETRGTDPQSAENMLVEGFFVPVLDEVAVDELREDLRELIAARLRE